ncbi:MAG: histidinol-phosphatase [Sphaerochaetaceae bacterium]|jgi:histidinol-phosphatase (PHP family)|nr:histidinol-phosphatase [Sphaerochaetaceae bacterium]
MKTKSNLHSHTVYCDGKNTMEEMVQAAISAGFRSLGFSSHAYTGLPDDDCGIKKEKIDSYLAEIDMLQKKYGDRIRLFKGFEIEGMVPYIDPRLDYSIGSVHVLKTPNGIRPIDFTPELFELTIRDFGNNVWKLLENYFEDVVHFAKNSDYDILGHFDLVTKYIEKRPLFDVEDPRYLEMAFSSIDEIIRAGKIIEVNTGAIARGWRTSSYPSVPILKRILQKKGIVTISSDCHSSDQIACFFEETERNLVELGFREQAELTSTGFLMVSLC